MSSFIEGYEKKVKGGYGELGKEDEKDPDVWGNAKKGEKCFNIYSSEEFINEIFTKPFEDVNLDKEEVLLVVDFGGAEGKVLKTVTDQLKDDGYKNIGPVDVDVNPESLKKRDPDLWAVNKDLTSLKLKKDAVNCGIMRFSLPYNTKEKQIEILEKIHSFLKPGGRVIILQDGAFDKEKGYLYDEFYAEASAAQGGKSVAEIKKNRFFFSGEELKEEVEKIGFKVAEARELQDVESTISPEAYASRFKMTEEQLSDLREVFKKYEEKGRIEFKDGRSKRSLIYFVLEK
jgi:SAM-dependent methyltransferase